jgi:hypothetical protein
MAEKAVANHVYVLRTCIQNAPEAKTCRLRADNLDVQL